MRWRTPGVEASDALLAAGLVLVGQAELWLLPLLDAPLRDGAYQTLPFALLAPAALALRRSAPVTAVAGVAGAVIAQAFVVAPAIMLTQVAALLAAVYAAAAHASWGRSLVGLVVACSAPATLALMTSGAPEEIAPIVVFAGAPWLAGRMVRRVRHYAARLEDLTEQLEIERERSAALAVAQERARVARELHDVLAHGVGVMTLQAGGARRVMERDPDRARVALSTIEHTGRQALAELRRLLDVIRPDPDDGSLAEPQPSLVHVRRLVQRAVGDVQPLAMHIEGEQRPLSPGLDLAAYRIVQEAVTNAVKHAPGAATTLIVRYEPDAVDLHIENDAAPDSAAPDSADPAPGGGRGLIGMRERVALYGGCFQAGPTETGGFRVHARLPLAEPGP